MQSLITPDTHTPRVQGERSAPTVRQILPDATWSELCEIAAETAGHPLPHRARRQARRTAVRLAERRILLEALARTR